jgi:hypothetical protein
MDEVTKGTATGDLAPFFQIAVGRERIAIALHVWKPFAVYPL